MQVRLTTDNAHHIELRLGEKPGLTTANKLANYFIAIGILSEPEAKRRHKARYDNASENVVQSPNRFKKFNIKP